MSVDVNQVVDLMTEFDMELDKKNKPVDLPGGHVRYSYVYREMRLYTYITEFFNWIEENDK
jgi:hypothetical protein